MRQYIKLLLREQTLTAQEQRVLNYALDFSKKNEIYTRKQFADKHPRLHELLLKYDLMPLLILRGNFDDAMGRTRLKLYAYTWKGGDQDVAYVGLTCDLTRRQSQHFCTKSNRILTAVGKEIKRRQENGIEPVEPEYEIIERTYQSPEKAAEAEQRWYEDVKEMGFKVLNNEEAIGNLGKPAKKVNKFHKDKIWDLIQNNKVRSLADLNRIDPDVARYVQLKGPENYGIYGERTREKLDLDKLKQMLSVYGRGEEKFKQNAPIEYYQKAKRAGWLDDLFQPNLLLKYPDGETIQLKSFEELYNNLDSNIKQTTFRNKLAEKGVLKVKDDEGQEVEVEYTNRLQEKYLRRLQKIIMEVINRKNVF